MERWQRVAEHQLAPGFAHVPLDVVGEHAQQGVRAHPIRRPYHGLKFSRSGECVDVPSAPQVCEHMGINAYLCIERGRIVWAYMGPKG